MIPGIAQAKPEMSGTTDRPFNPILDIKMYEVEHSNGFKQVMFVNAIAEHMFAQVDAKGNQLLLFNAIINHQLDHTTVKQADAFLVNASGTKRRRETIKG